VKIYTKKGDQGETGLIDGSRVPKDDARVAAYGDVDELNSFVGLARAHVDDAALGDLLFSIQKDLFMLGAQLADPQSRVGSRKAKAAIGSAHVETLEKAIDVREAAMPPLTAFLLPGGTRAGAFLHLCRTVCRRAERTVVTLARAQAVDPLVAVYLNRLSDLMFVLAREANLRGGLPEEKW
jgi:cob(I)alamin adenosyltransferase